MVFESLIEICLLFSAVTRDSSHNKYIVVVVVFIALLNILNISEQAGQLDQQTIGCHFLLSGEQPHSFSRPKQSSNKILILQTKFEFEKTNLTSLLQGSGQKVQGQGLDLQCQSHKLPQEATPAVGTIYCATYGNADVVINVNHCTLKNV